MASNPWLLLTGYSIAIVGASLLGVWAQTMVRLTHTRMQLAMSFVAGLVLGVALYHLLPHSLARISDPQPVAIAAWWMILGMIAMVLLLRGFQVHRHEFDEETSVGSSKHANHKAVTRSFKWLGISLGMGLHTMVEGVALGASLRSSSYSDGAIDPVGFAMFLAILFHKPLDAFSILGLMRIEGVGRVTSVWANIGITLLCPLGAVFALWGLGLLGPAEGDAIGRALAFGAGALVCVSLSDLLPEIHFHEHDRFLLTVSFVLGIALAYVLHYVEQQPISGTGF